MLSKLIKREHNKIIIDKSGYRVVLFSGAYGTVALKNKTAVFGTDAGSKVCVKENLEYGATE